MGCSASDLKRVMDEFYGGSERRFRHPYNPSFLYTEGVRAVAEAAGAYWLLDIFATELAPVYARAWQEDLVGNGMVKLTVSGSKATIGLSLADDTPDAVTKEIDYTDFPEGTWVFCFSTDELTPGKYVTLALLLQEY